MGDVQLDSVLRAESMTSKALQFEAQLQKQDLTDERKRRTMVVGVVLTIVIGVVSYFVSGVLGMRMRYPKLFQWYEAMRKEKVQGLGPHNFSLYQVCTAANFTAVQQLLNLLLVWNDLHFAAANFLMYCIVYFEEKAKEDPREKLTALHWAGSESQTSYDKLTGPTGWASTGCSTGTLQQRQQTLIDNWNRGKDENIWYYLLPQPVDETSKRAFLSVPMIEELYTDSASTGGAASACDPDSFASSKIGQLFRGGLCKVAHTATKSNESSADIFNDYFAVHSNPTATQSCEGAAAAGATQGAMTGGMSVGMMMTMVPGEVGIVAKVIGGLVATAGAAAVGGATSAAQAKEQCENDGGAV